MSRNFCCISDDLTISTVAAPNVMADDDIISGETWEEVAEMLEKLPEKERMVIQHYYFQNLNLKQIGEQLGVTESRVCQLRGQAVKRVNLWLKEKSQLEEEQRLTAIASRKQHEYSAWF